MLLIKNLLNLFYFAKGFRFCLELYYFLKGLYLQGEGRNKYIMTDQTGSNTGAR